MRKASNQTATRAGFTLIELLIVIAIVAVIVAILFPVFATVRERGRRTVCQSNLHQIALAMQQYVQDNDATYPLTGDDQGEDNDWQHSIYSYVRVCIKSPVEALPPQFWGAGQARKCRQGFL